MKFNVDLLEHGVGFKQNQNIQIRLSGEDIKFIATEYSLSVFIDKDTAGKIAFQINSLLQDAEVACGK